MVLWPAAPPDDVRPRSLPEGPELSSVEVEATEAAEFTFTRCQAEEEELGVTTASDQGEITTKGYQPATQPSCSLARSFLRLLARFFLPIVPGTLTR